MTRTRLVALTFSVGAFALASCHSPARPGAPGSSPVVEGYVASELAGLAAAGSYAYRVTGFERARRTAAGYIDQDGISVAPMREGTVRIADGGARAIAPPSGRSLGSPHHLAVSGSLIIRLREPVVFLGLHLSLSADAYRAHQWLPAGAELAVYFRGAGPDGSATTAVKAIAASAARETTTVPRDWIWIDLSALGVVGSVEVTISSPFPGNATLLLDNLTVSPDYRGDPGYFTWVILPESAAFLMESPELLGTQARFVADAALKERIVAASHLGPVVTDGADPEQWESVADLLAPLFGLPFAIALDLADLVDPDNPEEGSPHHAALFVTDERVAEPWWAGMSEDGLGSALRVPTPSGDLLLLHVTSAPAEETLAWAEAVLSANPDIPAAVVTSRPQEEPLQRLVLSYPRVFAVVSGGADGPTRRPVELLRNSADAFVAVVSAGRSGRSGDDGYLRLLRFYPSRNELRVLTYSPWLDVWEQDRGGRIVAPLDFERLWK